MTIYHASPGTSSEVTVLSKVLWDRKVDGGFPETKELKRRVRDVVEPGRDLGHVDRGKEKEKKEDKTGKAGEKGDEAAGEKKCEDCV